jgi:peptidoglycan/xylan/chitin deacetylase (PgdA/CDA1 family)
MTNVECRMGAARSQFAHAVVIRHSTFVIRHSSFVPSSLVIRHFLSIFLSTRARICIVPPGTRHMIRNTALFCLTIALAFSGCKKKPAVAAPPSAPVVESGTAGPADGSKPAPPSAPEFTPSATPPAPGTAAAVAKGPAKGGLPAIDTSASAMALCYHNLDDKPGIKALTISIEQFEKEMQGLKDAGFSVIPLQDFLAWRRGEKNIPHKSCIITIDDGWVSGYTNAWPILKKFNYPFTLFIYVNYVGTGGKSLSWEQLAEMRDAGVDIQCHTYSHANLKNPTLRGSLDARNMGLVQKDIATLGMDGWMKKEIIDSKNVIEQRLGVKVNAIAYPFGVYNEKARALVKEGGYEAAFTVYGQRLTRSSPHDLLGRYAIEAPHAAPAAQSKDPKKKKAAPVGDVFQTALQMIGGGVSAPVDEASTIGQLASASMVTQPLDKETITNPQPLIQANLATMGDIDPGSLKVLLSGYGPVPVQFNPETKLMKAQVPQKLQAKTYRVIVSAKVKGVPVETGWSFNVALTAGSLMAGTPPPSAPAPVTTSAATPKPKKK